MTHRADIPFYCVPRWDAPGIVVLYPRLDHADRSRLYTRARPALLTCFTCYRKLEIGGREFKHRHLYHFWSHYEPVWQARRAAPQPKERWMIDHLLALFVGLIYVLVVGYLAYVGWDALSRLSK